MRRVSWLNVGALGLALGLAVAAAWPRLSRTEPHAILKTDNTSPISAKVAIAPGRFAIADATGTLVPLLDYQRIVSTNMVTDGLLAELCEPTRILAISRASAERKRQGFRYQGMRQVDGFGPVETIIALRPDLVLTNSFGAPGSANRLRNAGVQVFDLGELRGEASFLRVTSALGDLLGASERARRLARQFSDRLHKVSAKLGPRPRLRAMYLSTLGPDLLGGTVGTSYHDIMDAAGLLDVAAERYRDWPAFSAEQVLTLAPDLVVTREGYAETICRFPGMDRLPACRGQGRIIELAGELLDDPGLSMLEAAEELFALAYGNRY